MIEKPEFHPDKDQGESEHVETTQVNGKVYTIEELKEVAETLPVKEVPIDDVREAVSQGHIYWIDREDKQLSPYEIIQDWDAAQDNEAWADHVASIKRANLDNPIWMTKEGHVFDGVHRLTRAVIDNKPTIKVIIFDNIPEPSE